MPKSEAAKQASRRTTAFHRRSGVPQRCPRCRRLVNQLPCLTCRLEARREVVVHS